MIPEGTTNPQLATESQTTIQEKDHSYVREDGKRVRLVSKSSLGSLTSEGANSASDVYIRADGKKVRRVKRGTKHADKDNDSTGLTKQATAPSATVLPPREPAYQLSEPMVPGDPPKDLSSGGLLPGDTLIAAGDTTFPNSQGDSQSSPVAQSSHSDTPKLLTAILASSLNTIDDITREDAPNVSQEKNPWISLPSFEDSVKSTEQDSVRMLPVMPFQGEKSTMCSVVDAGPVDVGKESQPNSKVYLAPIDDLPAKSFPVEDCNGPCLDGDHSSPQSARQALNSQDMHERASSPSNTHAEESFNAVSNFFDAVEAMRTPQQDLLTREVNMSKSNSQPSDEGRYPKIPSVIDTPIRSNVLHHNSLPNNDNLRTKKSGDISPLSVGSPTKESRHAHGTSKSAPLQEFGVLLGHAGDDAEPCNHNNSPSRFRLLGSMVAKTRSRADIDHTDVLDSLGSYDRLSRGMHQMTDADAIILNATLAQKRVKVVQLLFFGLIGTLVGFLGSFFVQSGCHFINATVVVGTNDVVFTLHYGIWKYTPIDSAFQGYTFCTEYDDEYTSDAPIISRIAGITALITGLYALFILWNYLILGRASYKSWTSAIVMAAIACISQGLTFMMFVGDVCQRNICSLGPGGWASIGSTLAWFLLSFEMFYNMPTSAMMTHITPGGIGTSVMTSLELSDFGQGVSAYFRRLSSRSMEPLPTLNEYQRSRDGSSSVGKGMMELNYIKRSGSYKPPAFD